MTDAHDPQLISDALSVETLAAEWPATEREAILRAAVAAMPHTNPGVADDLIGGFTMHTEAEDIIAIWNAARATQAEPVAWQFRWLNPGSNAFARPDELEWKPLVPRTRNQTQEQAIAELEAYRYDGKPCYEVRALGVIGAAS